MVEDVDIVDAKSPQALIKAGEKVLSRPEVAIGARPHVPTRLGGDDEFVAKVPEVLTENSTEIGLGTAVGRPVVIGQIEMGDAQVESSSQD